MTSDHQNREKEPYHFFQDDYIIIFSTQNIKIGPQTPEIAFLALLCPLKICASSEAVQWPSITKTEKSNSIYFFKTIILST